jgi:hypothetical protein
MKCRYCNIALAPLRTLTDGEFCCDGHRKAYAEQGAAHNLAVPPPEVGLVPFDAKVERASPDSLATKASPPAPFELRPEAAVAPKFSAPAQSRDATMRLRRPDRLLALKFQGQLFNSPGAGVTGSTHEPEFPCTPVLPGVCPEPSALHSEAPWLQGAQEALDDEVFAETSEPRFHHMAQEAARSWRWLVDAWRKAPSELKVITVLLPILAALAVSPSVPKLRIGSGAGAGVQKLVADRWSTLNKSILNRAAVAYTDDFRSGLDAWESRSNLTTSWSYDAAGFVQPGPLAVFRPTVDLSDYRFEFLGEIDQKGMGCAFRAPNLENYYAVRLAVVKPGPLPVVHLVRYAVIGGKEGPHVEKPLPFTARADMLYRIRVDAEGSNFSVMAQGQILDSWSDSRISHGGVGLFCSRGEKARVRWLEVSHQYDTLGRLCAYLAPYGIEGRNGNFN